MDDTVRFKLYLLLPNQSKLLISLPLPSKSVTLLPNNRSIIFLVYISVCNQFITQSLFVCTRSQHILPSPKQQSPMHNEGEQIPKATMTSYLKDKVGKTKISTEFTEGILALAKQYISRVANKANEICTSENKKTISLDHLYQTIEFYKLTSQMPELKKIQKEVKDEAMYKHEMKMRMQRSYDEDMLEKKQRDLLEQQLLAQQPPELLHKTSAPVQVKDTFNKNLFKPTEEDDEEYEVVQDLENDEAEEDDDFEVQEINDPRKQHKNEVEN